MKEKTLLWEKKGQLQLDSVKHVITLFLILGIVAVVTILIFTVLSATNVIPPQAAGPTSFINSSFTDVDAGRMPPSVAGTLNQSTGIISVTYTNLIIVNASSASAVPVNSANFTIDTHGVFFPASGGQYNNTSPINVSATVNWQIPSAAVDILTNTSIGEATFFTNTGTLFAILGATVIIMAIVLIIVAVQRFSNKEGF